MNIMLLWNSASEQEFSDSHYMTHKQEKAKDGQSRKVEHSTTATINTHAAAEMATGEIDFSKPKNKKPAQVSLSGLL